MAVAAALILAPALAFSAVEYEIVDFQDLGTLGSTGGTFPFSINELGEVTGSGSDAEGQGSGFVWADGQIDFVPGIFSASDINDEGDIVGDRLGALYTPPPKYLAVGFVPFHPQLAALHRNGSTTTVGNLDNDDAYAWGCINAINNHGVMVGYADAGKDFDNEPFADNEPVRAVTSTGSGLSVLSGFGDSGAANDINDAGQIVGWRREGEPTVPFRACLRTPGSSTIDVSPAGVLNSEALAINENGDVLGRADGHLFLRRAGGPSEFLPNTLFAEYTYGGDLNDQAWVVGAYVRDRQFDRADRAYFHDGTQMIDLNTLAAPFLAGENQTGIYFLEYATSINNNGQIVGYAIYRAPDGDDWYRGFILTLRRKPPALVIHNVGDFGTSSGSVEGVTVRLTLGTELFAEMVTDASGRATLPAGLDLDAVYNVEMHKVVTVPGHPAITIGRTYAVLKPSEVADDQVTLQFPETLLRNLEIQLRKIENPAFPSTLSPNALVVPYQTGAIRTLLADWGDLDPETLQLHAERDDALVRLLAGTESLALFLESTSTLSGETAALIGKTLTSLLALVKSQRELIDGIEAELAGQVAEGVLINDAALIAYAMVLSGGEQVAKAAADTFSAAIKNLVPATAADMANEALNVTIKGVVSAISAGAWDKAKGKGDARKKLLEDAAQKVIGEVGGRIFLSAHVLNTQDDLNLAVIRTRTFNFEGTGSDGRSAAINFTNFTITEEVDIALDGMRTLAKTADQFEVVADISEVAGSLTKMKVMSIAAQVIKTMNLAMVTAASVSGVVTIVGISDDYAPQGLELAFRPSSGGGGGGGGAARGAAPPEEFKPGKVLQPSGGTSITTAYGNALAALATALSSGDAAGIQAAASAVLAEEAALEAVCSCIAERLALLAAQPTPPIFDIPSVTQALASARTTLYVERGTLYPWVAGVIAPLLADPDVDTADILAQITVLQNALPAVDAAAAAAEAATTGLVAPASVVLLSHGLEGGSFTAENGTVRLQVRVLNPGDPPLTNLGIALIPAVTTTPIAPLRLLSPSTQNVAELAAGQTLTLFWDAVATDVSPAGTGSQAEYSIGLIHGGVTVPAADGTFGVRGSGPFFAGWIAGELGETAPRGFTDDADGDGVSNGLERFLSGLPGAADAPGLRIDADTNGILLRHNRSPERGIDTTAHYEWSRDLANWFASGASAGGLSVVLAPVVISGEGAQEQVVEIHPQVTGSAQGLFYRLRLEQDATEGQPPGPLTAPALISEPPASLTPNEGDPLTLTVVASGTKPLLHQWTRDGAVLPGGTGPTYSVNSATVSQSGTYRVRITGPGGVLESPPYEVTVGGGGGGGGGGL